MKLLKQGIWIGACALCCMACSTTGFDTDNGWMNAGDMGGGATGGGMGTGGSGSVDTSGNLLQDLTISLDDVPDTGFTDAVETIPTNSDDEEYEDYVENATFDSKISIAWSGTGASVTGSVEGVTVSQSGGHVTVNATVKGVEYVLSGTATDGSLKIYSDKKFKLTLNGVDLTSARGPAINIQADKRAYVVATAGTTNTLTDAASYSDATDGEDQKACLFSEGKLLFSGSGSLTVNGNYKHGICSDDYVRLRSGCNITVASAAKDGIHANDRIVMGGGLLKLYPSADGLECEEGDIEMRGGLLKAGITGTASRAVKAATDVTVSGGQLILLTSGGAKYDSDEKDVDSAGGMKCGGAMTITNASVSAQSTGSGGKGLKCGGDMTITGSAIKVITTGKKYTYSNNLDSSPKGIKAGGNLTITDSSVEVSTSGGDGSEGIESKATLTVNSGTVCVYAYDDCLNATSNITVNGGSVYCYSSGNDGIDSNGTLTFTGG
ncbi:MAG: carbohydrate-binding domain-containing protein, partial [Prevotellaceae bacterium]|nr:carbohydrate-binding domain-containing protein [Prevotellaceae bacterium]